MIFFLHDYEFERIKFISKSDFLPISFGISVAIEIILGSSFTSLSFLEIPHILSHLLDSNKSIRRRYRAWKALKLPARYIVIKCK